MFQFKNIDRNLFVSQITTDKKDSFAKTFVAKADMQKQWDRCIGAFDENNNLMGAIICTHSKRSPYVANLQLLHTFCKYRKLGVGKALCQYVIDKAVDSNVEYFRVSAEKTAVEFYKKIGFKFWGKQKSGCSLSIFKLTNNNIKDGIYDIQDKIVHSAVYKKGKGGCVEVYDAVQ